LALVETFKEAKDGTCTSIARAGYRSTVALPNSVDLSDWTEFYQDDCHTHNYGYQDCHTDMDWLDCKKFLCCTRYGRGCVDGKRQPSYPWKSIKRPEAGVQSIGSVLAQGSSANMLADVSPQASAPNSGEAGLAVFYSCRGDAVQEPSISDSTWI